MSDALFDPIDPAELAAAEAHIEGSLPLQRLPRLAEALHDPEGEAHAELDFRSSRDGLPLFSGRAQARVTLLCQRCLQPVQLVLGADFHLAPVRRLAEAEELPGPYEPWLMRRSKLRLADAVEDELLLALPLVARHESAEACGPLAVRLAELTGDLSPTHTTQPFAVLERLRSGPSRTDTEE